MGRSRLNETLTYCDEAKRYAQQVINGDIPACKWVRLACERQLRDLERAAAGESQWHFDEKQANRVCRFLENLQHIKGRWKTKTIKLEPWQCFQFTAIFGWLDEEGFRRFRKAYIELPRKNSKSTGAAGIALYMLTADGEPGPEVYSTAVTRDQARIVWEVAAEMVKRDPLMRDHYHVEALAHSITVSSNAAFFKPLSRDADSLEGLNPHCAIVDELHAHKTREVFDVMNVAMGSRRQSLLYAITTAGDNKHGVCYEQHDYIEKILNGIHEDDRYFGVIYTIDAEDEDWTTEEAQRKANPNYGISVFPDDMTTLCLQAQRSSEAQNTFLMKRLNIWTSVGTAYFNLFAWDSICKDETLSMEQFQGTPCLFTLDLASKSDLTTRIALFEKGGTYYVFGRHYLPTDALEPGKPNYDFYRGWATPRERLVDGAKVKDFWLETTEGPATDYETVETHLIEDNQMYRPGRVGVDPGYNAVQFGQRMEKLGVPIINVTHNVMAFSGPMKQLDALILSGKIKHNGDPVLRWAMSNVYGKVDVKGNVYPRKTRNEDKIDPAVALIAAMSLQLREAPKQSAYASLRPDQIAI